MTYLQILRLLERYAWSQPDVHSVVREFTDLNRETAQYSAVVIQDRDGERELISGQDWITYTWHIGYVDRLWEEKNQNNYGTRQVDGFGDYSFYTNRDDIYSQGIRVINNIIAGLRNDYDLEVTTPDRINTFNQRFTAECAGVYMVVAVTVPVSDCETGGVEDMYDTLSQKFTTNGTYHFVPDGKPWDQADIVIDVHPQEPLVTNFTENGTYDLEGEWKDAHIGVFVHPSTSLSETYTENGTYNIDGEFNGGQVTVSVDNRKPEESLAETITSNGSYSYVPQEGYVYDSVSLSVDVHPSTSLTRNYTTNGQKTITGEFNGGTININVHPSTSLSETYTSNGTYSIDGEFNGGQVTVAVSAQKPEESLVETITSNGSYNYTPQAGYVFDSVTLSVDVHPSTYLSETYTSNGTYSISGEFNGGEITVAVSGGGQKPEESLVETITSNGSYSYNPSSGSVFDGVSITVSVPQQYRIGFYTVSGWDFIQNPFQPNDVDHFGSNYLYYTYDSSASIGTYEFDGPVTEIGESSFADCVGIGYIVIPRSVTSIGDYAFLNCSGLSEIDLVYTPNVSTGYITSIGEQAFSNCTSASIAYIPSTVTSIGDGAFSNCSNLEEVVVSSSIPPSIGSGVFTNTSPNLLIYVPASSLTAYKTAPGWSDYASQIVAQ